jgi:hypothetical protein
MMKPFKKIPQLFFALWLFYAMAQGGDILAVPGNHPTMPTTGSADGSPAPAPEAPALHEKPSVPEETVPESPPPMEIQNLPKESVFVDTDRDIYFAGDHLFFKAYLVVNDQSANPLQSRVLYLSLGNEAGTHLYRLELTLDGPTAQGAIHLADTLQTAVYRLSAWTNNMLIADIPPFARQLAVMNRFDPEIRAFILENSQTPESEELPLQPDVLRELQHSTAADHDTIGLEADRQSDHETIVLQADRQSDHETIVLQADRQSYGPRQQVRLRIDPGRDFAGVASASLSVSREESLLRDAPHMASAFAVTGETNGNGSDERHIPARDRAEQPEMLVLPENLGPVVSGRVFENGTGRARSEAVVFLSAVDSLSNLKYSRTRADGSFFFLLDDYHRGKTLHLSVFETEDSPSDPRIELREKFPSKPFSPQKMAMHPAIHGYMEELLLVRRARRAYQTEEFGLLHEEQKITYTPPPLLYGQPTHRILTRDYLPMEDLSEMSIEIVPNLRVRQQGDRYTARMIDSRSSTFFPDSPVFFINGVWLPVIDEIAGLSSEEITRVEVLSRPWAFGSLKFSGIVSIFTMKDLHRIPSHPTTKIIQGSPFRTKVEFDPDPHAGETRPHVPDYREVLYWEPSIRLQPGHAVDLSFTTSDMPGNYVISLEGYTECGTAFSQTSTITVE